MIESQKRAARSRCHVAAANRAIMTTSVGMKAIGGSSASLTTAVEAVATSAATLLLLLLLLTTAPAIAVELGKYVRLLIHLVRLSIFYAGEKDKREVMMYKLAPIKSIALLYV